VAVSVALGYLYLSSFFDLLARTLRWPAMFDALEIAIACI
jgi:hypothetical protein